MTSWKAFFKPETVKLGTNPASNVSQWSTAAPHVKICLITLHVCRNHEQLVADGYHQMM